MPDKELKRLNTVSRFLQLEVSKENELQQIVELAAKICGTPMAMLSFIDTESQYIKYQTGVDIAVAQIQDTICQHTIKQTGLMVITDTTLDERLIHNDFIMNKCGVRFYAGSPLATHDEQNIGTLCVCGREPKELSPVQQKMLQRLSRQASQLLEFDASLALLKAQAEHARAEEDKLRSFFESTSSCHLLLDSELRVVSYNKAIADRLQHVYGLPIEEGMLLTEFVEPTFLKEFTQNCREALKGIPVRTKSSIASPQGPISWSLAYDPALDANANIIGVCYSATDISQTVEHEKTINSQETSFRQIDQILAHELAAPMRTLAKAMSKLPELDFPNHQQEISMLTIAFEELQEKSRLLNVNE